MRLLYFHWANEQKSKVALLSTIWKRQLNCVPSCGPADICVNIDFFQTPCSNACSNASGDCRMKMALFVWTLYLYFQFLFLPLRSQSTEAPKQKLQLSYQARTLCMLLLFAGSDFVCFILKYGFHTKCGGQMGRRTENNNKKGKTKKRRQCNRQ